MKVIRLYITTVCLHSTKKPVASFFILSTLLQNSWKELRLGWFQGLMDW